MVLKPGVKQLILILNCRVLGVECHNMSRKASMVIFDYLFNLAEQLELKSGLFQSGRNIRRHFSHLIKPFVFLSVI